MLKGEGIMEYIINLDEEIHAVDNETEMII